MMSEKATGRGRLCHQVMIARLALPKEALLWREETSREFPFSAH
jgi:hypothetical protein